MVPAPARSWARATIEYVYPHEYGYMAVNAACATIRSLPRRLLAVAHCTPRLYTADAALGRTVLGLTRARPRRPCVQVHTVQVVRWLLLNSHAALIVSQCRRHAAPERGRRLATAGTAQHSSRCAAAWRARGRAIEDLALDHSD